eukprot:4801557-Pleurochrysis_carterae.AAC.4
MLLGHFAFQVLQHTRSSRSEGAHSPNLRDVPSLALGDDSLCGQGGVGRFALPAARTDPKSGLFDPVLVCVPLDVEHPRLDDVLRLGVMGNDQKHLFLERRSA